MIITPRDLEYMRACMTALDEGKIEPTLDCSECDETIDPLYDDAHAIYIPHWGDPSMPNGTPSIMIACEGYYMHANALK